MQGYLSLVLHAHLPFVRHPEHDRFLEESWLFEAVVETYIPLIQIMEGWRRDGMDARLTLTLSPTLCAMLQDELLQDRCLRHIESLIELAEKEVHRTHWDAPLNALALMYHARFTGTRTEYLAHERDLVAAFRKLQESGRLEIITCSATHAVLPLLAIHPPSVRAQVLTARDHYRECFGCDPRGFWLPECAYAAGVEDALREAGIRWFITDTHGILHARPKPRYGVFAPVFTPNGIAAFGRDMDSARQVWSRNEGYPGDPHYRDFYRDAGFDLDFDYVKPYLPDPGQRGFTGVKYHSITGGGGEKRVYDRATALQTAAAQAGHFLEARMDQIKRLAEVMERPPMVLSPYDAELFGHWWYEGPEFLDYFVRKAYFDQNVFQLTTPQEYLTICPTQQVALPSESSWGAEGYWNVWLNETNQWIYPHLRVAQQRMTDLARRFQHTTALQTRALKQAGRELLLAQSSDWPFILRTGSSPDYARKRVRDHILRFTALRDQLIAGKIDEEFLNKTEQADNLFPNVNYHYWA